jgi:hypothetical protein
MEKLYSFLFCLSVLALSCSKDSLLNSDQGPDQLINNATVKASGMVIPVYPNNSDDTPALIDAFDQAKASGQNAVVKLMSGTYKISLIEVKEFNGKLVGSGQGKTIITNIFDLPTPDEVMQQQNKVPALITFIGGDVEVLDLTVKISELDWVVNPQNPMGMPTLLFSDYSNDYMPSIHHINVKVNNIEIINSDNPGVSFGGLTFEPAKLQQQGNPMPRSNIDAIVTNCKFSNLGMAINICGCKSGSFVYSGNIFYKAFSGIHENLGVAVKILKNNFIETGIDINAFEQNFFEYSPSNVGTYELRDNIFNSSGFGLWDNWRYDHPENPDWMRMIWDHNTFNIPVGVEWRSHMFGFKNTIFSSNIFTGNGKSGKINVYGSWLSPQWDPDNYWRMWTEGVQFLNNVFQQRNFVIELNTTSLDCLIKGNLKNLTVINDGLNNTIIGKTN